VACGTYEAGIANRLGWRMLLGSSADLSFIDGMSNAAFRARSWRWDQYGQLLRHTESEVSQTSLS